VSGDILAVEAGAAVLSAEFPTHISKDATEKFVGIELFVPSFEGELKKSTRPAMRVLTAGTL
jgi:hypothetical protein